ncbi:hypothetical protein ATANTOWER_021523 [Ataeniobius toweri]|uniref:Uncharacterized protein n=1 Tax=Ataeniobius toweri TaxID=208326 RepID=A0ABU7AZ13_9TELE|nr:hypothetical protein [Ataeniobius toweri]
MIGQDASRPFDVPFHLPPPGAGSTPSACSGVFLNLGRTQRRRRKRAGIQLCSARIVVTMLPEENSSRNVSGFHSSLLFMSGSYPPNLQPLTLAASLHSLSIKSRVQFKILILIQ